MATRNEAAADERTPAQKYDARIRLVDMATRELAEHGNKLTPKQRAFYQKVIADMGRLVGWRQ
ncbi:hypothetical protein [Actinocatenispora rupis]|uniref:Uncharacterized protein n=1 Tax=Actinocatenispora rupis TaxID=519421 RepID=A0A8J3J3P8_9ACTN|nr:hypothetical protein [Actinocatenispora rupis]GID14085.1 hypothetical protein Aru02nite_49740 [Actinocatenispora rupis]